MKKRIPRAMVAACVVCAGWGLALLSGGCTLFGAVAESYRKDAIKSVSAESDVLAGKTFAVVVTTDRSIQGDHPGIIDYVTTKVTERLAQPSNIPPAAGVVAPARSLRYVYDNPSWNFKTKEELAKDLGGVERLVVIEITDYRLNSPGNAYLWDGLAAGMVSVYDPSSSTPELAIFEKTVMVKFPDQQGLDANTLARNVVNSALALRFVDRVTWPFYTHDEAYYQKY